MPSLKAVGSQWLKDHYKLSQYNLTHCSYIGQNDSLELTSKGNVEQVYGIKYAPHRDEPMEHLEFSLKYDDLNLDFLKAVLEKMTDDEVVAFIAASPKGKYARKIGFLYEFLTGRKLKFQAPPSTNYTDLLEEEKYFTGQPVKNPRWKINNNLLGNQAFCPMVRKTRGLVASLEEDIRKRIEELHENYPPEVFNRASSYLYKKETRSSYEIEKEKPSADRMERFIALLMQAGTGPAGEMMSEVRLTGLQHVIVDSRFAAEGFRNFQNYVGELLPGDREQMHYICPPPQFVPDLMSGLKEVTYKMNGVRAEVRAAVISFGFVFIHPFDDGNGRLHRFLIHDVLVNDGAVPRGLIVPVSAHMLNQIKEYDQILERFSEPLIRRVQYRKKEDGTIEVTNPQEVEGYYRYPDLTPHCQYLTETIFATIREDMPEELAFIQRYDEVKEELQNIVDMPDKDINLMILFLHQNKGIFPNDDATVFPSWKTRK